MATINIHEAKTHLSRLVERASEGEEIIIARAGVPAARLVPLAKKSAAERRIGFLEGEFVVPDDVDTMAQEDIIAMFEGRA